MKDKNSLDEFAKLIWGKRAEGLPVVGFDPNREITKQELEYMHIKFAYVQIFNPYAMGEISELRFIRASSGWLIFNYKNAMTSSPGDRLWIDQLYKKKDEEGDEGGDEGGGDELRIYTGTGTRTKQIIDTAAEMVHIAKEEEMWPAIHIVNGTDLMCWGIWKAGVDLGIEIAGYVPSKAEEAKRERIERECPILHIGPTAAPAA